MVGILSTTIDFRNLRKHCVNVITHFKQRFLKEYLNALKERHNYQVNKYRSQENRVVIGAIVLLKEDIKQRVLWQKGRIT